MSSKRGPWIARRGQADAEAAIGQVIDHHLQPGEQVQYIADMMIEDSPYQARLAFSEDNVEDLAQAMRESGFQGVLIVRPHGEPIKRERGLHQLVYGHRRRVAWQKICSERGESCLLPVVVREISDAQLLTIGAQENLQRQDLNPVEEAQIIAWHERMFFEKNQAEIGVLLGKSADWVSVRSRIYKLPDALKECLRQRPRAIKQMLELGVLYTQQPQLALDLADRVVAEHLTVEALRTIIGDQTAETSSTSIREERRNRRAGATSVRDVTINGSAGITAQMEELTIGHTPFESTILTHGMVADSRIGLEDRPTVASSAAPHLHAVAEALATLAAQADELSSDPMTLQHVEIAEQALVRIRRAIIRRTLPSTVLSRSHPYRLHNAEISDLVLVLRQHNAALVRLYPTQGKGRTLYLMIYRAPVDARVEESSHQSIALFVATLGGSSAIVPGTGVDMGDWARRHLRLAPREAVLAAALLRDLQTIFLDV